MLTPTLHGKADAVKVLVTGHTAGQFDHGDSLQASGGE